MEIPALGTTHADYFDGPVPVTRAFGDEAIRGFYVHATGLAIVECFRGDGGRAAIDPMAVPACLVSGHAPFVQAWRGCDVRAAVISPTTTQVGAARDGKKH